MIEQAGQLYYDGMAKLQGFTEGSFLVDRARTRTVNVLDLSITPTEHIDPNLYTVLQPRLKLSWIQERANAVYKFVIDPHNLAEVSREEVTHRKPGLLERFFPRTPRTTANQKELEQLSELLDYSSPTLEFRKQINQEARRRQYEVEQRRLREEQRQQEIERARQVKIAAERVQRAKDAEAERMRIAAEEATRYLDQAQKVDGRKILGIIVDDAMLKEKYTLERYNKVRDRLDYSIVFDWQHNPVVAVRFIAAVQSLNPQRENLPVVVFMDGTLEGELNTGLKATEAIKQKLDELGLPMPYLAGNAGDSWKNRELAERYPDQYVTETWRDVPSLKIDFQAWELEPYQALGTLIKQEL